MAYFVVDILCFVSREHLEVSIRINVSATNAAEVPRITEVLDRHGLGGQYYLARVDDFPAEAIPRARPTPLATGRSSGRSLPIIQPNSESLTRPTFAQLERELLLDTPEMLTRAAARLEPRGHFCSATSGSMFVIDPDGFIGRCWEDAGVPSHAMGNVLQGDGSVEESDNARRWRDQSPFAYPECTECRVLPLCMGGCSYPRVFLDAKNTPCESIRFQIQHIVREVGSRIMITEEQSAAIATD